MKAVSKREAAFKGALKQMAQWILDNPNSFGKASGVTEKRERKCIECLRFKTLDRFVFERGSPRRRCRDCCNRLKRERRRAS